MANDRPIGRRGVQGRDVVGRQGKANSTFRSDMNAERAFLFLLFFPLPSCWICVKKSPPPATHAGEYFLFFFFFLPNRSYINT